MKGQLIYLKALVVHKKLYDFKLKQGSDKMNRLYREYFNLLRKAAYIGNAEAQFDYAQQFESIGYLGVENPQYDPKRAIYWYKKACSNNHPAAYNNLAHLYEKGEGCKRDIRKALNLYEISGQLGYKIGENNYKILKKQLARKGYNLEDKHMQR